MLLLLLLIAIGLLLLLLIAIGLLLLLLLLLLIAIELLLLSLIVIELLLLLSLIVIELLPLNVGGLPLNVGGLLQLVVRSLFLLGSIRKYLSFSLSLYHLAIFCPMLSLSLSLPFRSIE